MTMMTAKRGHLTLPQNPLVVGVGDSIVAAASNTAGAGITPSIKFQPRLKNTSGNVGAFLAWASILPKTGASAGDGRFRYNGCHATSGLTVAQIKSTHIDGSDSPLNDSPKPGIVVICAGQNDAGSMGTQGAIDTRVADVKAMCISLFAAGILPVVCAVPPNSTSGATKTNIINYNASLATMCATIGILFADTHTPCNDGSGGWIANYNADGTSAVHPSVLGAQAMGQALRDAIDSRLYSAGPNLVTAATDGDADLQMENGAFERDGDSDGVPNGGGPGNEINGYWSKTANGTAWTLGARSGFSGQAWRWEKTSDAGDSICSGTGSGSGTIPLTDGHLYEVGFIGEIASWSDVATTFNLTIRKASDASKRPFDVTLNKDTLFGGAIAPFAQFHTFRCNATDAPAGDYRFFISLGGANAANLADVYLGQLTLRDLGVG